MGQDVSKDRQREARCHRPGTAALAAATSGARRDASPQSKQLNITESLGLENTLKILEFNPTERYIHTISTAAKKPALQLPKPDPIYFQSSPGSYSPRAAQSQATSPSCPTGERAPSNQSQPRSRPACSPPGCRRRSLPNPHVSPGNPHNGEKTERLENPGKRFNMSSDKLFLTRGPKLGFFYFFSPISFFSSKVS